MDGPQYSSADDSAVASMPPAFADRIIGRVALAIGNTGGFCGVLAMPLWLSAMRDLPGVSIQAAGAVGSCYIGGLMIGSVATAPYARRINRKLVATGGFALMALCLASSQYAPSALVLGFLFLVAGIGAGTGLACTHSIAAGSRNPPRVFALMNYGMVAFAIAFFGTAPDLTLKFGSGIVFLFTAGIGALAAASMLLVLPAESAGDVSPRVSPTGVGWRSITPVLWLSFAGTALFFGGQDVVFSYFNEMAKNFGFDPKSVSSVLAVSPVINIAAPLVASFLAGRVQPVGIAAWCSLAMVPVAILIGLAPSFLVFGASLCLFMFTCSICAAFLLGMTAVLDPTGRSSAAMPAVMLLGSSFGPVVGGTIAQQFGFHAVGYYGAMIIALSTVVLFSLRRLLKGMASSANAVAEPG